MHKLNLGTYKNLKLAEPKAFSETDFEKAVIEYTYKNISLWAKHNLPIDNGDNVTVRVEAKRGNLIVPEFSTDKLEYSIGDKKMLKQFSNSIGKKNGETFTMEHVFDENCPVERVRNKKVNFVANIIDVEHNGLPEITDDLIQKIDPECNNLDELKSKYAKIIKERVAENVEDQKKNMVLEKIIDNSSCDYDENAFKELLDIVMKQSQTMAKNFNIPNKNDFSASIQDDPLFIKECKEVTKKTIMEDLVINKIAELENIQITEDELENNKAQYTNNETSTKEFREYFPTDESFKAFLFREKVLDWLCKYNY